MQKSQTQLNFNLAKESFSGSGMMPMNETFGRINPGEKFTEKSK
jgi:hypothetical protein